MAHHTMSCVTVAAADLCVSPALQFSGSPERHSRCSSSIAPMMTPDRSALSVAILEQLICPLGCADRRIFAMLVDQELCGAVDVEVGVMSREVHAVSKGAKRPQRS
jgi:hypothetical protein